MSRAKRRCVVKAGEQQVKHFPNPPDAAATDSDRSRWQGFCEIESEPAIFNTILSKWGVEGVRTREVTCLDEETLRNLPQPVYGIIFLFRYNDLDAGSTDESPGAGDVWFATQNMDNMCGTLALMNMVMNIEGVDLGETLSRFRESTMHMSPVEKGNAVADFAFIRRVHNSWAKKSDMLSQDLKLQDSFRKAKRRKSGSGRGRKKKVEEEEEAAYHFTAYLPVGGKVWKLDGIDEQPQEFKSQDNSETEWLQQVATVLSDRMALLIGEGIQFNVLAMTKDPLLITRERLIANAAELQTVEARLKHELQEPTGPVEDRSPLDQGTDLKVRHDSHGEPVQAIENGVHAPVQQDSNGKTDLTVNGHVPSTKSGLAPEDTAHLEKLLKIWGVSTAAAQQTSPPNRPDTFPSSPDANKTAILNHHHESLAAEQAHLYRDYVEEEKDVRAEAVRAEARRWDHGPIIGTWVRYLAERDDPGTGRSVLETLIHEVESGSAG